MRKATIKSGICATVIVVLILLFSGCIGMSKKTVSGTITDLRYYGAGLESYCEVTIDNVSKYPIDAGNAMRYNLKIGMKVTLVLSTRIGDGFIIESMKENK